MTLFTIKADTGSIVAEDLSRDDLRMAEAQGLIHGDWLAREGGGESWIKVREVLKSETLGEPAAPKGKAAIDPEDEALELKSPKGPQIILTLKELRGEVAIGNEELSAGFVRPSRQVSQPAEPWVPVKTFLTKRGKPSVPTTQAPVATSPTPLPFGEEKVNQGSDPKGSLDQLPAWEPYLWGTYRTQFLGCDRMFTVDGAADKLEFAASRFLAAVKGANLERAHIFRAKEFPFDQSNVCLRVVRVIEGSSSKPKAGQVIQVRFRTNGPNLDVEIFRDRFRHAGFFDQLKWTLWFLPVAIVALILSIVVCFSLFFTRFDLAELLIMVVFTGFPTTFLGAFLYPSFRGRHCVINSNFQKKLEEIDRLGTHGGNLLNSVEFCLRQALRHESLALSNDHIIDSRKT